MRAACVALLAAAIAPPGGAAAEPPERLEFGFGEPRLTLYSSHGEREATFDEARRAGAGVVRLLFHWRVIAPARPSLLFDPTNPWSPEYSWHRYDQAVREAVDRGMRPVIAVYSAPDWAEAPGRPPGVRPGTWRPAPGAVAAFATALAKRYSGSIPGLPQVRDYIFWNEPNHVTSLTPVWTGPEGRAPAAPAHYVRMLNAFHDAVKAADPQSRVIAGATAPYGTDPGELNMRPVRFWRQLLCLRAARGSGALEARRPCGPAPRFDALAHHPINLGGGPHRSASHPADASTPDLRRVVRVLRAAEREGTVGPGGTGRREVWATELWWESNPPDPAPANPSPRVQARWYVKALRVLWRQGADTVLAYQVRDQAYEKGEYRLANYQTGAYYEDGRPKPAARALRFPFMAKRRGPRHAVVWGLPPEPGRLVVRSRRRGDAVPLARFRVREGRPFSRRIRLPAGTRGDRISAAVGNARSRGWKLDPTRRVGP